MKNPAKILIIRLSSIGDVLLSTPLIRALHRAFPEACVDFVIKQKYVDVVGLNPLLGTVHTLDTSKGSVALKSLRAELLRNSYDLVVDIHNNFRSVYLRRIPGARVVKVKKYKWKRFLLVRFGLNRYRNIVPVYQRYIDSIDDPDVFYDGHGLDYYFNKTIYRYIDSELRASGLVNKLTICLAPGASFATKRWPAEKYAELAQVLVNEHNVQILLVGDDKDAVLTQTINRAIKGKGIDVAGKLNLSQTACAIDHAHCVITNDTGLMHLATALKKPTVAIFGPTVKELGFFPIGEKTTVVENLQLSCRPCTHMGRPTCPKKHFQCMLDIDVSSVLDATLTMLPSRGDESDLPKVPGNK